MTDKERIERAAKEIYSVSETFKSNDIQTNRYDLQEQKRKSFIDGAETEANHWQPILFQKDETIKELVSLLQHLKDSYADEWTIDNEIMVTNTINKYKQP